MKKIKNIIFDFGGVILNIDHQKVEKAFKDLGLSNFEELFNQAKQSSLFQDLEKGAIKDSQFRKSIKEITGLNVSDEILDDTWNQIIGNYPYHRIELLKNIQNNYKTYILSNTNSIHYKKYIQQFREEYGFDFVSLFSNTYWSFLFGKRKPDADPYIHILETENLKAEETLFIDDSVQNIIAARKLNIFAFHLTPEVDVSTLFKDGFLKPAFLDNLMKEQGNLTK